MTPLPSAGFAFLSTNRVFSSGVVALEGHAFRRITLTNPLPMEAGLQFAAQTIQRAGRPPEALCGCELRMPCRLTREAFSVFNRRYIAALQDAGFPTLPVNPAARTNMAPLVDPPAEAVLAAFTFTVPFAGRTRDFLISGKPELATAPDRVIAPRDSSPTGVQAKADFVFAALRDTVRELQVRWSDATAAQIYTRHPLPWIDAPPALVTHIPGDPPVLGPENVPFEFEADVRSITFEETV